MTRRVEASDHYQARPMTENELKQHVLVEARRQGWIVYHVPQATMRNGGGAGYPDLTLARDKELRFIELKTDDGKLSPEQRLWQDALPHYYVLRPVDLRGRVDEVLA